jgi:hypothetical protein
MSTNICSRVLSPPAGRGRGHPARSLTEDVRRDGDLLVYDVGVAELPLG